MVAAWWSILLLLCEKHALECTCLKHFVNLCHCGRRQEFLDRNHISKNQLNVALNVDTYRNKFTVAQKSCVELINMFEEITAAKKSLFRIYGPGGSVGGFKSNPKPYNKTSTLIASVFQDVENNELQRVLAKVEKRYGFGAIGPLQYDGFQSKIRFDQSFLLHLNTKYIKWAEKKNVSDVDAGAIRLKIEKIEKKANNWLVPAHMYSYVTCFRGCGSCGPPFTAGVILVRASSTCTMDAGAMCCALQNAPRFCVGLVHVQRDALTRAAPKTVELG